MATVTAAVERWEQEQVEPCLRCGGETTVAPHAMGTLVGAGVVCDPCRFFLEREGEWGDFLARLARLARPTSPDGPDDDPPSSPAAIRPGVLTCIAAHAGPIGYELSPEEEAELDEFERLVAESAPDPEPCACCGRPASPRFEAAGGPLCWRCADRGAGGPALQRDVHLTLTFARLLAARTAARLPGPPLAAVPATTR